MGFIAIRSMRSQGILVAALASALATSACSSSNSETRPDAGTTANQVAPVGTWTFDGDVPNQANVTFTIASDGTFTFVEFLSPVTSPAVGDAGVDPGYAGCSPSTDTYRGTYTASSAGGTSTLSLAVTSSTGNMITGCANPAFDSPGAAMTPDEVDANRGEGYFLAASETYVETSSTLVLSPAPPYGNGVGLADSTVTFTKSP
jgi:hypothetical protein